MKTNWDRLRCLAGCLVLGSFPAQATLSDANFTDAVFVGNTPNLGQMTGIAWAPDGSNRLFAIRKTGQVMIIQNGALLPTPFATLSPIFLNSECGLVGFTFDPGFATNGYIYFFITVSSSEQQILRYTAVGNSGTDRTVIMSGLPTAGNNHDGGGIGIGPDGKLYWAIGDLGNSTGVNTNLTSLAAKVGRANRDGTVPLDNPFVDGAGPNNDFIWARGMRNPFTLTFQPGTGNLWVNVVGTNYEQVFVVPKAGHAGYNAYENNQPAGFLTPVIKYRTNGTDTRSITATGASRSGNVATFTTTSGHQFRKGEKVSISGVANGSFNGSFFVRSANTSPTASTFTVEQTGPDASSGGGSIVTQNQGGCISGGAFWDSTAAPPDYRGNFFYGDFNSGRMMRAVLGPAQEVVRVDYFSTSGHLGNYIDTAIGPDGAIYYASVGQTTIRRAAIIAPTQALFVTPTYCQTDEGSRTAVTVRLAVAPANQVAVDVARTSGDADLVVASGASLIFTPANFAVPQTVMLEANHDADAVSDQAGFTVTSPGLASQEINLTVLDDDIVAPLFTSVPKTKTVVGAGYSYQAMASGGPAPTFSLGTFPVGMTINSETGMISWQPGALGDFPVTILASNGILPGASQSFSINVSADQPPVAVQTKPVPGEIVSGTNAEWFGDGLDDVGCTQAQFFIDDVLAYTDSNTGGHYHFGGAHLSWDTTLVGNGEHTLRMTVTDTAGQTHSVETQVIIANGITPLEGWRQVKFSPAELLDSSLSGNNADFDGDGFTNLMEYALGTEPKAPMPAVARPQQLYETVNGQTYLSLRYLRPQNGRSDFEYLVEVSSDLADWRSGPAFTTESDALPQQDGTELVTVRSNTSTQAGTMDYIRLKISPP